MKYFVSSLLILIVIFFGCTGQSGGVSDGPVNGQKVYKQYCVACHGVNGGMQLNGARDLRESALSLEERISVVTNGRKLMAAYNGILTAEEIREVAAYTLSLGEIEKKEGNE